jgi:hypothetical protein
MALPNNTIAGVAPAYVSYLELYQNPRTGGLNGDYAAVVNEYTAPLVDAASPANIAAQVTTYAHSIPHVYVMLSNTVNGPRLSAFTALGRTISAWA